PVTTGKEIAAQRERDHGRRVERVRIVLFELNRGLGSLSPRRLHTCHPKPEPQDRPGVPLHPPLLCERESDFRPLSLSRVRYGTARALNETRDRLSLLSTGRAPGRRPSD